MNKTAQELIKARLLVKQKLDALKDELATIDDQLIEVVDPKIEGTTSLVIDGYRLTVIVKINRTINQESLESAYNSKQLPQQIADCVKWKPELDLKKFRSIENEQDYQEILKSIVNQKLAKPSIKIEELDNEPTQQYS
jgi:hypothetical protein